MMTTPQQTRIALSEIPDRLEALRVATTTPTIGNRHTPDEPTPANIFNMTPTPFMDNTTNVALAQEFLNSTMPSPDEFVIRQRGRRRFTTTWSPDQMITGSGSAQTSSAATPARSPFQRTPTKLPPTTSMILRSSPRKRLTMGTTPPDMLNMAANSVCSPPKHGGAKQQLWPGTPIAKKLRLGDDERPMSQLNIETPLNVVLQGMSKEQLIVLIIGGIGGDAKAEEKFRTLLPMPDIGQMEQDLQHTKRNIFKSLPTSRLCKKTDSTAYARAALHLNEFKRLLNQHTKELHDSGNWDALLDYITMAWNCVRATPNWDSTVHNAIRRQCFKLLACHCIASVKYGGLRLGANRLHTLERNLNEWSKDYEDVLSCVNVLNRTLTKSRSSL